METGRRLTAAMFRHKDSLLNLETDLESGFDDGARIAAFSAYNAKYGSRGLTEAAHEKVYNALIEYAEARRYELLVEQLVASDRTEVEQVFRRLGAVLQDAKSLNALQHTLLSEMLFEANERYRGATKGRRVVSAAPALAMLMVLQNFVQAGAGSVSKRAGHRQESAAATLLLKSLVGIWQSDLRPREKAGGPAMADRYIEILEHCDLRWSGRAVIAPRWREFIPPAAPAYVEFSLSKEIQTLLPKLQKAYPRHSQEPTKFRAPSGG